jgi:hypothetical protein
MNRRLTAEQIEFVWSEPIAPCLYPAICLCQVQIAAVPVIGIVTAALAGQIAGVGRMRSICEAKPAAEPIRLSV